MPVREIVAKADTVMFCLSKALGAPAGSMLAGPAELIAKGRLLSQAAGRRHAAGGRAGRGGPDRARRDAPSAWPTTMPTPSFLAEGLARIPGIRIDPHRWPPTSWSSMSAAPASRRPEISARLKRRGVLMNAINDRQMRAVTHYDVDRDACAQALEAIAGARVIINGVNPAVPRD